MVGNDVVDLGDPEAAPGSVHPRFDVRVLTAAERAWLLARPAGATRLRWSFWAAKEAAYKLARKVDSRAVFSPPAFAVDLEEGEVRWRGERFPLVLEVNDDSVHAIVGDGHAPLVFEIGPAGMDAGNTARGLALTRLAQRLGIAEDHLAIRQAGKIPRVHARGRELSVDLSLSHHGRFVAFAAHLPERS